MRQMISIIIFFMSVQVLVLPNSPWSKFFVYKDTVSTPIEGCYLGFWVGGKLCRPLENNLSLLNHMSCHGHSPESLPDHVPALLDQTPSILIDMSIISPLGLNWDLMRIYQSLSRLVWIMSLLPGPNNCTLSFSLVHSQSELEQLLFVLDFSHPVRT